MKIKSSIFYSALFLGLLSFASCKKDETPKPEPITPEAELFQKVQGRWTFSLPAGRIKPPVSSKNQEPLPSVAFVEFFSDNTFILHFGFAHQPYTGSFEVKNSNTIELEDLGVLSNVTVTENTISFTFTLSEEIDDVEFNTTGSKVAAIQVADNRKGIVKKWYLALDGDISEQVEIAMGLEADRVERTFTAHGTIYTEYFSGEESVYARVNNWRLHETEDAIVEYYGTETEGYGYYKVKTLSADALSFEHFIENSDGEFEKVATVNYSTQKPVPATRKR